MILNSIMKAMAEGYPYETGEYTPSAQLASMAIPYAKVHALRPAMIVMIDGTFLSAATTGTTYMWAFIDFTQLAITPLGTASPYGIMYRNFLLSGSYALRSVYITTEADLNNYATNRQFLPTVENAQLAPFKANHTYKWIAIWL